MQKYEFTSKNVDQSPNEHGVYLLYDGNVLIYIGRAWGKDVTIRSRLQSHMRGDEGACTESATHYSREVREDSAARELELLKEFRKTYGRLPRCNDKVA